jgi:hypothetical protein
LLQFCEIIPSPALELNALIQANSFSSKPRLADFPARPACFGVDELAGRGGRINIQIRLSILPEGSDVIIGDRCADGFRIRGNKAQGRVKSQIGLRHINNRLFL